MRRKWLVAISAVVLTVVEARAAFQPPETGPFSDPDTNVVHAWAGGAGVTGALVALFPCAALLLPLDLAEEIRNPESEFGSRYAGNVCVYPMVAGYYLSYFVVGFPIFLGKVVFWDVPRRFWWDGPPPVGPEPKDPRKPEQLPTGVEQRSKSPAPLATTG